MTSHAPATISRIRGGLGNQMFCYAAARALATRLGGPLILDNESGFRYDTYRRSWALDPFNLQYERFASARESYRGTTGRARRIVDRKRSPGPAGRHVYFAEQSPASFDKRWDLINIDRRIYLDGLFQSPQYFEAVAEDIRHDLDLAPFATNETALMIRSARDNGKTPVAVGVRLYEEAQVGKHDVDNGAWFKAALDALPASTDERKLFVFCSDPDAAVEHLRSGGVEEALHPVATDRSPHGALHDMAAASSCSHFIVANSSYSWWAAWLGATTESTVICSPLFRNRDIRPAHWSTIP